MNDEKLLTIAIPTYNRACFLNVLLGSIYAQLIDKNYPVNVIVFDNNSSDETAAVVASYKNKGLPVVYKKNKSNIGADGNIARAFVDSASKYVWVVGDDDILLDGAIRSAVEIIKDVNPSLVFIGCRGFSGDCNFKDEKHSKILFSELNPLNFLKRTNISLTFISAVIVNKYALVNSDFIQNLEELQGTNLVQLGWVLPSIRLPLPLIYVSTKLIAARNENRGGYGEFNVFVKNFSEIVAGYYLEFPRWVEIINNFSIREHYTLLIMFLKLDGGAFHVEDYKDILLKVCGGNFRYWIYLYPLLKSSGCFKRIIYFFIRVINFAIRFPLFVWLRITSK